MFLPMLMKWALNGFSRNLLQHLAEIAAPITALMLKGDKYIDPIDNRHYSRLLPYGYIKSRPNALAPGSLSLERHRLLYLYLQKHTNLFKKPLKVLHVAPELCLLRVFKQMNNLDYVTADLCSPWAEYHFDAHAIPFRNNTFDVVIANHLLEHVQDDQRVLSEFFRIMKPDGWGVFQVPLDEQAPTTREDPFLTDVQLREKYFGQKDHLRQYGMDYIDRLKQVGFHVEVNKLQLLAPECNFSRFAINPSEPIVVCYKT